MLGISSFIQFLLQNLTLNKYSALANGCYLKRKGCLVWFGLVGLWKAWRRRCRLTKQYNRPFTIPKALTFWKKVKYKPFEKIFNLRTRILLKQRTFNFDPNWSLDCLVHFCTGRCLIQRIDRRSWDRGGPNSVGVVRLYKRTGGMKMVKIRPKFQIEIKMTHLVILVLFFIVAVSSLLKPFGSRFIDV